MFWDIDAKKKIDINRYPNGEWFCKEYCGKRVLWILPDVSQIVLAINILSHCEELYIAFLLYGRSDRNFFSGQQEPILSTMLRIFSVYENKKIFIMDPHSDLTYLLDDNIEASIYTYSCMPKIVDYASRYLNNEFVVIFPDKTSKKRYGHLVVGKHPWIEFDKTRDVDGNIVSIEKSEEDLSLGSFNNYLMIDDICSYGGTFLGVIDKLVHGNFYLACAHCEDKVLSGVLLYDDRLKKIFTSNSILSLSYPKLRVVYECEKEIQ